ncbi:MAG: 4-hydroxythreonine-4-phosphate dehydrogenase PdxA, partial [Chitinophagaceae bacterium]|nr:4-hydroxythreonine-4-phosphate dehydrogenase PdxA [Chitinophagaceae bacterium]
MNLLQRPVLGISIGDLNGVGTEIIIKTFGDHRLLELCTPVIFASNKVINFYRKTVPDINFSYQNIKDFTRVNHKQINIFNCWEEEVGINPGQLTETGGKYAIKSLTAGVQALKENKIHGLITAPIHKKNTQSADFDF